MHKNYKYDNCIVNLILNIYRQLYTARDLFQNEYFVNNYRVQNNYKYSCKYFYLLYKKLKKNKCYDLFTNVQFLFTKFQTKLSLLVSVLELISNLLTKNTKKF